MPKLRKIVFGISLILIFTVGLIFFSNRPLQTEKEVVSNSTPNGYIKATVKDLQILTGGGVVFLSGDESEKVLQIHIGMDQAHTLARVMNNMPSKRPMAHDLLEEFLKKSETDVAYISVDRLEADTYYATIVIRNGGVNKLDARPSDSIIIALKLGVPIYVNKDLLEVSGVVPGQTEVQQEEARPA